MHQWSEEMIQKTIRALKPYADEAGEDFTRDDAVESMDNMMALFEVLVELDQKQRKEEIPRLIGAIKQLQIFKSA